MAAVPLKSTTTENLHSSTTVTTSISSLQKKSPHSIISSTSPVITWKNITTPTMSDKDSISTDIPVSVEPDSPSKLEESSILSRPKRNAKKKENPDDVSHIFSSDVDTENEVEHDHKEDMDDHDEHYEEEEGEDDGKVYCICRQGHGGRDMVQCDICQEW